MITIDLKKMVPEAVVPKSATQYDTGYDLVALDDGQVNGEPVNTAANLWKNINYIQYRTGLQIAPRGKPLSALGDIYAGIYYTLVFPRSSVSKYNLLLANSVAVIDTQYRGELLIRFKYVWQPEDYSFNILKNQDESLTLQMFGSPNINKIYRKGDRIAQIAAFELNQINFNEVESLEQTVRNEGGFGSTGA